MKLKPGDMVVPVTGDQLMIVCAVEGDTVWAGNPGALFTVPPGMVWCQYWCSDFMPVDGGRAAGAMAASCVSEHSLMKVHAIRESEVSDLEARVARLENQLAGKGDDQNDPQRATIVQVPSW